MANPRKPPPDIPPAVFRGGSWLLSSFNSFGYALVGIWERAFTIPTGSARDWHSTSRLIDRIPFNWSIATAQVVTWDMNYTGRNIDNYRDHHVAHIGVGVGLTVESDRVLRLHLWDLLRDKNGDDHRRGQVRARVMIYANMRDLLGRSAVRELEEKYGEEVGEVKEDATDVLETIVVESSPGRSTPD